MWRRKSQMWVIVGLLVEFRDLRVIFVSRLRLLASRLSLSRDPWTGSDSFSRGSMARLKCPNVERDAGNTFLKQGRLIILVNRSAVFTETQRRYISSLARTSGKTLRDDFEINWKPIIFPLSAIVLHLEQGLSRKLPSRENSHVDDVFDIRIGERFHFQEIH